MYKTVHPSDLYFKVHKIHYVGDKYVKCRLSIYYKSSDFPCEWLRCKNYKVLRHVYDSWVDYSP